MTKRTILFSFYAKIIGYSKSSIEYDDEFIDRITVYRSKEEKSDVDERENARYSSSITSREVEVKYKYMEGICKKAISQTEEIVFSDKQFKASEILLELGTSDSVQKS